MVFILFSGTCRLVGGGRLHLLLESFDPSLDVKESVLSGIQGMALVADFNRDMLFGRTSRKFIAAGANDGRFRIICWMDVRFHKKTIITDGSPFIQLICSLKNKKDFNSV